MAILNLGSLLTFPTICVPIAMGMIVYGPVPYVFIRILVGVAIFLAVAYLLHLGTEALPEARENWRRNA